MKQYVTYGLGNHFDFEKVKETTNLDYNGIGKPSAAWWGSPTNAIFGWRDWCENEEFIPSKGLSFEQYFSDNNKITWHLEDESKVYIIYTIEDVKAMKDKGYIVNKPKYGYDDYEIDFHKILEDGYVAVELYDPSIGHTIFTYGPLDMLFNSWDCESIVVLDPAKIVVE